MAIKVKVAKINWRVCISWDEDDTVVMSPMGYPAPAASFLSTQGMSKP